MFDPMPRELTPLNDWRVQLLVWGWAVDGHDDVAVFVCERPELGATTGWWDRDAAHLDRILVAHGDEAYHRPPDHWALPGVLALRLRRDGEFWRVVRQLDDHPER